MIVSWNWLREYVSVDASVEEVAERLTMSGLNLEQIDPAGNDFAIDLEVTSNRPDCLGHIGVAREVAVLYDTALKVEEPRPTESSESVNGQATVTIEADEHCPLYVARVIRGAKVGPSPDWLKDRLAALGVASINNVVDITNYVLFECGQPLHAFDLSKLAGSKVVVRESRAGEKMVAINQREYELPPGTCVIADAESPVAIAGVMGGLATEISDATTEILIESAMFAPLSVRNTARTLSLHSDSSYRFERGTDPHGVDWASRRCCELILQLAGGELLEGSLTAGKMPSAERDPIRLRYGQIARLLGMDVPPEEAAAILRRLGLKEREIPATDQGLFVPPTWRRDLEREVDLIEEVARIAGYERIPEDAAVPVRSTSKSRRDRVAERVRNTLAAAGFFEAVTLSFVTESIAALFAPRAEARLVKVEHSTRKQENVLRPSLVPSLLQTKRDNERHGSFGTHLFEIAKVYLAAAPEQSEQDVEPTVVSLVSSHGFAELRGVLEGVLSAVKHSAELKIRPSDVAQFTPGRGAEVRVGERQWGWLGELDISVADSLDLRDTVCVAEVDFMLLQDIAELVPVTAPLPQFPAMQRDLNFVLDEDVAWADLEQTVHEHGGGLLESIGFGGQYRGKQLPAGKKSYVVTTSYRSSERTLTGDEVDAAQQAIVSACERNLGAVVRG